MKNLLILTLLLLCLGCGAGEPAHEEGSDRFGLQLIARYDLNLNEPSGLTLSGDGVNLWTLSDRIYIVSPQGEFRGILPYRGSDMEGIAAVGDTLWIVEERYRELVQINMQGEELARHKIPVKIKEANNGLEGITYNTLNKRFYLVNESKPKVLIRLDENFKIDKQFKLKFCKDLSGICYDAYQDQFWIVSDRSGIVARCSTTGKPVEVYQLGFESAEGIAVDAKNKKIYIVSDEAEQLYVFKYPF
ncbi:MAG: hypothetical protein GY765_42850 [bacterium]|nr:hypothetical protein [bacterium]